MHRSEQARLTDCRHRVGRHHHVGSHAHLDVGVPVAHTEFADASHDDVIDHDRRIRFQCTDIRDLDMVHRVAGSARDRAG
jgi:hypothetical protein